MEEMAVALLKCGGRRYQREGRPEVEHAQPRQVDQGADVDATRHRQEVLSAQLNGGMSSRKRNQVLVSPAGVELRQSTLLQHAPVPTGKQMPCNYCGYTVPTQAKTGTNSWGAVQNKRKRKGRSSRVKCSVCGVHLCVKGSSCWADFHAGAVPARVQHRDANRGPRVRGGAAVAGAAAAAAAAAAIASPATAVNSTPGSASSASVGGRARRDPASRNLASN